MNTYIENIYSKIKILFPEAPVSKEDFCSDIYSLFKSFYEKNIIDFNYNFTIPIIKNLFANYVDESRYRPNGSYLLIPIDFYLEMHKSLILEYQNYKNYILLNLNIKKRKVGVDYINELVE